MSYKLDAADSHQAQGAKSGERTQSLLPISAATAGNLR
jgi:hypothetical protein